MRKLCRTYIFSRDSPWHQSVFSSDALKTDPLKTCVAACAKGESTDPAQVKAALAVFAAMMAEDTFDVDSFKASVVLDRAAHDVFPHAAYVKQCREVVNAETSKVKAAFSRLVARYLFKEPVPVDSRLRQEAVELWQKVAETDPQRLKAVALRLLNAESDSAASGQGVDSEIGRAHV